MEMETPPDSGIAPIEKRPLGITLGAIALCVMGCAFLLLTGLMVLASVAARLTPVPNSPPLLSFMPILVGSIFLLVAAAYGTVAFHIFKRRPGARIGIIVVGILQAFMGFSVGAIYFVISFVVRSQSFPAPANGRPVNPQLIQAAMLAFSGLFSCVGLIGLWWAIYFNRRRIRDWFEKREPEDSPSGASVTGGMIGILLNVYAVLLLFGAIGPIFMAASHIPLFLAIVILRGHAAVAFDLTLAVAYAGIGISLLRRDKIGWYGAFVLQAHAIIIWAGMILPSAHQRLLAYQLEIHSHFAAGTAVAQPYPLRGPINICVAAFGTLVVIAVVWLLVRSRRLFFSASAS
jgi:hypothetical protein